jgi:formate hydrogenlyase subunit 3/multisubunit Na+/H+ antiporter MnhD subunit
MLRPRQKRIVYIQKMSARDKREVIGAILMIAGGVLIVVGLIFSYIEWSTLSLEKLALMAVAEGIGLGIGMTLAGFILFGIGLGVHLADNNRQAWSRARRILPH